MAFRTIPTQTFVDTNFNGSGETVVLVLYRFQYEQPDVIFDLRAPANINVEGSGQALLISPDQSTETLTLPISNHTVNQIGQYQMIFSEVSDVTLLDLEDCGVNSIQFSDQFINQSNLIVELADNRMTSPVFADLVATLRSQITAGNTDLHINLVNNGDSDYSDELLLDVEAIDANVYLLAFTNEVCVTPTVVATQSGYHDEYHNEYHS